MNYEIPIPVETKKQDKTREELLLDQIDILSDIFKNNRDFITQTEGFSSYNHQGMPDKDPHSLYATLAKIYFAREALHDFIHGNTNKEEYRSSLYRALQSKEYIDFLLLTGFTEEEVEKLSQMDQAKLLEIYAKHLSYGGINDEFFEMMTGTEATVKMILREKPDVVLIAPNSATLPAFIAKKVIANNQVKQKFHVSEDYDPYFTFPKVANYKQIMEITSWRNSAHDTDAWKDFDLLIDAYQSADEITDIKNTQIPRRDPRSIDERQREVDLIYHLLGKEKAVAKGYDEKWVERYIKTGDMLLKGDDRNQTFNESKQPNKDQMITYLQNIYHDMEQFADAIERKLQSVEDGKRCRVMVFDESVYEGTTMTAFKRLAQGAVKILIRRGVIQSEDDIEIMASDTPWGGHKPQFPSLKLTKSGNINDDEDTPTFGEYNRIIKSVGNALAPIVAHDLCHPKK